MHHLDFIVWMCCFPLSMTLIEAIEYNFCAPRDHDFKTRGLAALIMAAIWFGVGYHLW